MWRLYPRPRLPQHEPLRRPQLIIRAFLLLAALALPAAAQLAVRGETVYTMTGAPIQNGVVLVSANGTIERVGPASQVTIPAGMRTLSAKVVMPGLIDAHATAGLSGVLNQPHDQDQIERSAPSNLNSGPSTPSTPATNWSPTCATTASPPFTPATVPAP